MRASTAAGPRRGTIAPISATPPPGAPPDLQIEVVSDAICPWCYVAKRNLDAAVAELRRRTSAWDVKMAPVRASTQICPRGGLDRKKKIPISKVRGRGNTRSALDAHVTGGWKGPPVLISIMSAWNAQPNTFDAHRLDLVWRKKEGVQDAVVEGTVRRLLHKRPPTSAIHDVSGARSPAGAGLDRDKVKAFSGQR